MGRFRPLHSGSFTGIKGTGSCQARPCHPVYAAPQWYATMSGGRVHMPETAENQISDEERDQL